MEKFLNKIVDEYEKDGGVLKEPFKWVKIDISTFVPHNAVSFHVGMKDFVAMYSDEPLHHYDEGIYGGKFNQLYDLINGAEPIDDKFLIEKEKIMGFVFTMREMRKLHELLTANITQTDVKWIRFYSYNGKYVVTNDCDPIEWKKMTNITMC